MNLPYFNRDKTRPFIKNLWLFFVFALLSFGANAQNSNCPTNGHVQLYTQQDVNNFALTYPNCTEFTGQLRIQGSTITDLSPLSNIASVGQYIIITGTSLTSLEGLNNITNVARDIMIVNNPLLSDISALSNVNTDFQPWQGYGLQIEDNPQLSTCNLPNFCSYLLNPAKLRVINNNAGDCLDNNTVVQICTPPPLVCPPGTVTFNSQAEVNAFAATYPDCTQISGSLYINGNDITDLTPLSNITTITYDLTIASDGLTNLNGLQNLQKIGHNLIVSGTNLLTTLNGLNGLTEVKGEVLIYSNSALQDISALLNIDSSLINTAPGGTYGIAIFGNPQLAACNIPSLCEYLSNPGKPRTIENNAGDCNSNALLLEDCIPPVLPDCPTGDVNLWSQVDVNAFAVNYPNCTVIAGDLDLRNDITDLSPLSTIQSITGDLTINGVSLTHLNDLSNLTSVGGDISIYSNHYLQDISGLSGITTINSNGIGLTITSNTVLTVCGIPNICSYLANPNNPRTIENNAGNCGNDTVISYYCASPDCPMSDVFLYSQDDVNAFAVTYPNCTQISGNLIINGATITDLSPLSNIQSITGNLNLQSTSLTNLDDLENLTSVKTLFITNNTQLQSIAGLSSVMELVPVTSLGLVIQGNSILATCNIPSLCAYISNSSYARTISNNAGGCADNAALVAACYVPPACPEGGIAFTTQAQLNNFAINYPNCTNFAGSIVIGPSSTITDLSPLSNLQTIGGELYISNLVYLQDLDGLDALTSVGGNLTIHSFGELQNVNALSSLTTVGGTLQISGIWNPQFQNLQGLNNLTSVGSLTIQSNSALVDLNALESLTHIDKNITIESNNVLDDISVLSQLDTTVPPNWITLRIMNNPVLATCNLPYICSYITTPGAWFMINGNAGDCTNSNNLIAACNSQPASCVAPSNLSFSSVTHNQASLDWENGDNFNNFVIEFGPSGFTAGTGTVVSGITTSSYVLSNLEIGTAYDVYVHKNCGYNNSTALTTSFSTEGYCSPIATDPSSVDNGNYIKNFATAGAITNISNVDSGYAANGYGNFSGSHSASHYPGQSIDFEAVDGNNAGTRGLKIWIDWNKNSVFDAASELVFSSAALQSGTHSGNFQIPANTAPGHYRMRLFLQENTLPADPCNTTAQAAAFGELEDYTLTVLEPSACNLDTVASANIISNKATINWTSPGSLFEMEWGPAGFAQGTGTQQNGITTTSYILEGLTEQTTYDVYVRNICTYNQSSWVKHTFATRSICPSGDLVLQTQAQIDDFGTNYPNCTAIAGNVNINGTNSNINNLVPLNNIVSISGGFTLYKLPQLTGVNGFISLTTIGGSIDIYDTKLTNLNGLASLTNVGNTIIIGQNPLLTNISGIKNINPGTVSNFSIYDNANLAICNYDFICSYLAGPGNKYIASNATGCQNQAVIATACATCDAPANLTHVPGAAATYTVKWTSTGSSFDIEWGAEGFVQGTGTQQNGINTTQCSLPGLQELASYDIYIRRNCTDTQSTWVKYTFTTNRICPEINNSFYFYSQEEVDAFAATYPDCTQILGNVGIYGAGITNLTALSNIQNVLWGIEVRGTSLTSLNDLSSLTSVGGSYLSSSFNASFIIGENPLLTDISILDNIDTTYFNRIDIVDNESLEVCNYPIICNFLGSEDKTIRMSGNDQGCENSIRLYNICGYECPPSSLEFNTQAAINSFATYFSECTHINGSLTILEGVEDLTPLSNLESIQGGLSVEGTQLTNLNGLSSLTSIGGLVLGYNGLLTDFSALENVTINPAGDLYVMENPSLSVCGIGSICNYLQQGTGNRQIQGNAPGCQDLLEVYAACDIAPPPCPFEPIEFSTQEDVNNFAVLYPDCTALPFSLFIYGNDITDLSPLSSLTSINGGLYIVETGLEHLDDLSALTAINGEIMIANNTSLNSISGLQGIDSESIVYLDEGLFIVNNPQLSVCSLENLCSYLSNYDNPRTISGNAEGCGEQELNAICGVQCPPPGDITFSTQEEVDAFATLYPNCTQINGNLDITSSWQGENAITDLSPLNNIQTIEGGLTIYGTFLTHLNGLSNLTAVNGAWLSISENNLLEDVSGLSNVDLSNLNPIDMQYDGLYIGYNPLLSVCNVPNFCSYLSNDPATHPRIVENNAEGCEDNDAIAAACLEPFPCLPPASLTALATNDNATISWASMGTSFDIEWGVTDFTQGEGLGAQDNISELNYTIAGLSTETSYDVYVRRNCADGESNWVKYTFSTLSVCPSGDLTLSSQEAIDAFGTMYPDCTQIQGSLNIGSMESQGGITDLSPLSNIQSIQGGLVLLGTSLTNLNGLSNLTAVNGMMLVVYGNSLLEDISGLSNVALNPTAMQGNGLFIGFNPLLSVCNIPAFCEYLGNPDNPRSISDNAGDCVNADAIVNKCFAGNCESYTIWNGTSWSNGIPDNTKRVIVRNDLTISSDMTACELLLQAGIVNVSTGATFTVEGEIFNTQTAANFIVESDANLIQLDDVENTGAITVKRNSFPLYRQDYTLWSSPVAGQNLRAFSPATLFNRFSSYDASLGANGDYVQEIVTAADMETKTFIDAKGYMIRMPNNWPVFVNETIPGTVYPGVFKGTPHNGSVAIPLSSANSGLNLVGNPYPSNISIESLFDANPDIQRVLYFWRKRNDVAGSGYATYTSLGLTSLNAEIDGLDLEDTIKPGQGFFVQANSATVLNFDNLMRTSGQNGHFLRSGNTVEKHRFWLNLSMNNQVLGQTLIGYVSGATSGIDNGIDAAYFNDSALALTSLIEDNEYSIQGRSLPFADSDVVPLGFKSDVAGNFTISLSNFDGLFAADQLIYLKDNATGTLHNLKAADYSFATTTGVFNDRFEVQYSSTLGTNNPIGAHNAILIGVKNQNIQINAGSIIMEKVELIDVTGRIIYTQGSINAASVLLENVASSNQVLVVRISTRENGTVTQKIIF